MAMPKGALVMAKSSNGRFAALNGLTEQQAAYVRFFVSTGGDRIEAARLAGYAQPAARAADLDRHPVVQRAIAESGNGKLNRMAILASDLMLRRLERATQSMAEEDEISLRELRGIVSMALERLLPAPKADTDPSVSKADRSVEELESELNRARLARADAARLIDGSADSPIPHPSVPSLGA